METQNYHYIYYSYEEWGRGYIGSRTCKCTPEKDIKYFGSFKDKTFKPKYKIILKCDYATREEAYADEIALQKYYKVVENPHFVNRSYQTSTGFTTYGSIYDDTFRQKMSIVTKGQNNPMYGKSRPDLSERNKKRKGCKTKYSKLGKMKMIEVAQKVNSQKWKCKVTGYISTSAGVVSYQKGKGIDTSKHNRTQIY